MDHKDKLSHMTIFLHWIVALTMIALTAVGFYMTFNHSYGLYPYHKAIGVIILLFAVIRVVWRYRLGWPEPVREYPKIEHSVAHAAHWILILATVLMPISGMMGSGAGGHGISIFGLELVPSNYQDDKAIPFNETVASIGHVLHTWLGYILAATIALHLLGAFKHHWVDKDLTLKRMLGKRA
ncbi:cytochrome b [Gynuella sunshinyii]|uniref:Cytochrome B561 n=1 Tax=Gynuella sunshinyii YC6258 TaxID=1445510 RepID=A0A0C5VBY6_9GAMM|nr:cytochrome b [Gynuella sunshinyii]AJQ96860.1 cytochrome B561 [Gynuella sunshinyii YC6258]